MDKQALYLVYFESAHYAGYGEHILVWAKDAMDAEAAISDYADEQDGDQMEEDGTDDGVYSSIMSIELFDESHKDWEHRESFNKFN